MPFRSKYAQAAFILGVVLLLRLPFLNQAIQGDDFYYLKGAEHALVDPLHPAHTEYVYQGRLVDMRGHPHPPLNSWYLALVLAISGSEREVPLHAAYILFSVIAALSALSIARRYTDQPVWAVLLFVATPVFVVNGNSLEADVPFNAFWLAAIAAFIGRRYALAALCGALAGLAAYQAVVLVPVLGWFFVRERQRSPGAITAILSAPAALLAWHVFERLSSGAVPAAVLAGYMASDNLQALAQKIRNAEALTSHLAWLVFPGLTAMVLERWAPRLPVAGAVACVAGLWIDPNPMFWMSCGLGVVIVLACARRTGEFLCWWVLIFFLAALAIFFAGSQRYLLPAVLPLAILVARDAGENWMRIGLAAQLVLSIGLAVVNYQHWGGYRDFVRSIASDMSRHRTWTNAEWGLRHYLEAAGAVPLTNDRMPRDGDLIVTSSYSRPVAATATIADRTIQSSIPLRIVALEADSAYSSVAFGLAPFAFSRAPLDRVRAGVVAARKVGHSSLLIGTPDAEPQIVAGISNHDRWTAGRATVLLKRSGATTITASLLIPPAAPARTLRLLVDGNLVAERRVSAPGAYTLEGPLPRGKDGPLTATLEVDRTFTSPPDTRELGVLLLSVGLR